MNDGAAGAEDAFGRLAAFAGILPEYLDVRQERQVTSRETQRRWRARVRGWCCSRMTEASCRSIAHAYAP